MDFIVLAECEELFLPYSKFAKRIDPDQAVPSRAAWSRSPLIAKV